MLVIERGSLDEAEEDRVLEHFGEYSDPSLGLWDYKMTELLYSHVSLSTYRTFL
jgi:hypothetical protein